MIMKEIWVIYQKLEKNYIELCNKTLKKYRFLRIKHNLIHCKDMVK